MPTVAVIMPAYQAASTVGQAVRSVLAQTFRDWELIVVDDASADDTPRIVAALAAGDPRVRLLRNATNLGAAAAMNRAWRESAAPLVAILDADDVALPRRLETQVSFLAEHPETDVLGAAAFFVDPQGGYLRTVAPPGDHARLVRRRWLVSPFIHPTVMMRRGFLEATGGYRASLRLGEDYDLWMRGFHRGGFTYRNLPVPLVVYRTPAVQRWANLRAGARVRRLAGRREGRPAWGALVAVRLLAAGAVEQTGVFAWRDRLLRTRRRAPAEVDEAKPIPAAFPDRDGRPARPRVGGPVGPLTRWRCWAGRQWQRTFRTERPPELLAALGRLGRPWARRRPRPSPPPVYDDLFLPMPTPPAVRADGGGASRTHVIVCLPFLVIGGAERVVSRICRHLRGEEFEFTIVASVRPGAEDGDSEPWFAGAVGGIYRLPELLPPEHWREFLFRLVARHDAGVLWVAGSAFAYELLPELKTRFPWIKVIDLLFNEVGHTSRNRAYNYCIDLNVVENDGVAEWLRQNGETADRIRLIPNGVDVGFFRPSPAAPPPPPVTVGFLGRLSDEKGPDLFLDLAGIFARREDRRVRFLMAGVGPLAPEVRSRLRDRPLGAWVEFPGEVESRSFLARCDVLVAPSRLDGRPNAVMEALACGVPVIASRVGGIPDLIADGRCGYLCPPGRAEPFEQALQRLLEGPARLGEFRRAARAWAVERLGDAPGHAEFAAVLRGLARAGEKLRA